MQDNFSKSDSITCVPQNMPFSISVCQQEITKIMPKIWPDCIHEFGWYFLKKHNMNMAYYKIDKIHLNTRGSKALAKEIKRQI